MPTVDENVFISVPPEEVFDYIDDPKNLSEYSANVIAAELEGPRPVQLGSRIRGTNKILGRTFDWVIEVVEHDRPNRIASKSVEGKINFTVEWNLAPEGQGTRLQYRVESDPGLGGVFGRLADPLVEKAYARQVRADLDTLAQILTEHGGSA